MSHAGKEDKTTSLADKLVHGCQVEASQEEIGTDLLHLVGSGSHEPPSFYPQMQGFRVGPHNTD